MRIKKETVSNIVLVATIMIAFLSRLYLVDGGRSIAGDEIGYHKSVIQFIEKGVYGYKPYGFSITANAFTMPGYIVFLAPLYLIFGYSEFSPPLAAIQMAQIMIQILAGVVLFKVCRMFLTTMFSILAVIIFYFHPTFLYAHTFMLTETLYGLFFLTFLLLTLYFFKTKKMSFLAGAAVMLGISILIRPSFIVVIPIVILFIFILLKKKAFAPNLVFLLCFCAVMSPWWIRNYLSLGEVTLLASQGGNPLLWGTYPFNNNPLFDQSMPPEEMGKLAMERIKNGFLHQPLLYISWYSWGKTLYLIKDIWPGNKFLASLTLIKCFHYLIVSTGFIGLILMLVKRPPFQYASLIFALCAMTSFAVYLPFAPTSRYFYSALPLLIISFCYVSQLLFFRFKDRQN
ncbi:glycosyltransferase family 39 protein [Paenibacillus pasadenensis]|uniref:glycosyltransferase family 39 protein n=1 Tax=Paenibacillus pasadenensis TaxID=217090 RepID=UPI00203C3716|nr:glycosyltransferase family 39 protein [Paenibacillus pasadenensis]MCM3748431.1 glycosyltransferase family 39 protein [Paenibacillus pasadenensis]